MLRIDEPPIICVIKISEAAFRRRQATVFGRWILLTSHGLRPLDFFSDCEKVAIFPIAIKVQLHGGKNPLYCTGCRMTSLSTEPAAASLQRFNWSGPPPGTRNILQEHLVHV